VVHYSIHHFFLLEMKINKTIKVEEEYVIVLYIFIITEMLGVQLKIHGRGLTPNVSVARSLS
jgi:hypothetical protein